jgi:hypothetical protein
MGDAAYLAHAMASTAGAPRLEAVFRAAAARSGSPCSCTRMGFGAMYLGTRTGGVWTSTFIEDDVYVFDSALAGQTPERLRYGTR